MLPRSIKQVIKLKTPWQTQDPFIFCAYHKDLYPLSNGFFGPNTSLKNRNIGQDFSNQDGWSMYHGQNVPGFPYHPHRGFETVSIVKKGVIDHSDSLGGQGRFKAGDVQWLTSGKGIQHAEMFPLLNEDQTNTMEMFQLWLNLPQKSKFVEPHYKMLWKEDIPLIVYKDAQGYHTTINLIAGKFESYNALDPTPSSWAADPENHVQIWTIEMEAMASFNFPQIESGLNTSLFFYEGDSMKIDGFELDSGQLIEFNPNSNISIVNGMKKGFFLFLQGKPINEPVAQYGPFVMNTREEIQEAMQEYRQTQFGGWPFDDGEPVHGKDKGRFAIYNDGKMEHK